MVAALFGFYMYNRYPAKVFPGDSITWAIGALIAGMAILGNFEKIAIFIFIPYYVGIFLSKVHPVITRWFFEDFSMPYGFLVIWTIGILGIILLVCVLAVPIFWIYANWKKAKENAEEEVTGESGYCIW